MPSSLTHIMVGLAMGQTAAVTKMPRRFWILSAVCAVLPDADVLGFRFGISYDHFFGHRGFSHSFVFALLVSLLVVSIFFSARKTFSKHWWALVFYFFIATASNGILDALTDGGLGIAFLAPFDNARYFFPWHPIPVAPIGIGRFLSPWGMRVLRSEVLLIWLPALAVVLLTGVVRKCYVTVNARDPEKKEI